MLPSKQFTLFFCNKIILRKYFDSGPLINFIFCNFFNSKKSDEINPFFSEDLHLSIKDFISG